jgi:CheY-like chemotaxis protein
MTQSILLIDDNEINLELMSYLLGAFGYEVRTACDGPAGLAAAERDPPDLILCDVVMPGMDGYTVARMLAAHSCLADVPVVAVTALAMVDDRDKVFESGFDGYITKPIDPETFPLEIASFLKTRA